MDMSAKNRGCTSKTDLTKSCHKTPVGSSKTRTYAVITASSFSMVGRVWGGWTVNNLCRSAKRVNPQSDFSAMNLCWASITSKGQKWISQTMIEGILPIVKMLGSCGFDITSANCAHTCQPCGLFGPVWSRYKETVSFEFAGAIEYPNGKSKIRLLDNELEI